MIYGILETKSIYYKMEEKIVWMVTLIENEPIIHKSRETNKQEVKLTIQWLCFMSLLLVKYIYQSD